MRSSAANGRDLSPAVPGSYLPHPAVDDSATSTITGGGDRAKCRPAFCRDLELYARGDVCPTDKPALGYSHLSVLTDAGGQTACRRMRPPEGC